MARGALFSAVLTWSLGCTLGCAPGARRAEGHDDAVATSWHYRVTLPPSLTRLDAELCFDGAVPRELRAGKDEAAGRLRYARWLRPGPKRRLAVQGGRVQLDSSLRDGCLEYGVSLAESGSLDAAVRRVGDDLLASPNVWLWRPERRAHDARARLALQLPAGHSALLPWPQVGGTYALDTAAFRFDSYAAFGRFQIHHALADQVRLEAALLDGELAIDGDAALRWLGSAVRTVSESDGTFPAARLTAIVVPAGAQAEPVPFGMIARGGAASLLLLVSAAASEAALNADWVLPHELSHLLLPFVEREAAWLSEGLATYYQELLPARAGILREREALRRIAEALRSASREPGAASLVAESARMHFTQRYRRVYWGGAAYWLNTDVALRRHTQGHRSLDHVLSALRREGALATPWTTGALVERLDALAGTPVFSRELAALSERPFPAFEATLEALGVRGPSFELDDAAPLADIRRALFAPRIRQP